MSKRITLLAFGAGVGTVVTWCLVEHFWKRRRKNASYVKVKDRDVIIVDSVEDWEGVYQRILNELSDLKVLGLDCEWVGKRPVALLQLATPNGVCILVRLFQLYPHFPQSLRELLSNRSILKTGVAVGDDGKRLLKDYGLGVNGCVDLRHLVNRSKGLVQCHSKGLQSLTKAILKVDIDKDPSIRCGNWEAEKYSEKQIDYAATDAAVAVDIFMKIVEFKLSAPTGTDKGGHGRGSNVSLATDSTDANTASTSVDTNGHFTDGDLKQIHTLDKDDKDQFWALVRSVCQGLVDIGYTKTGQTRSLPKPNPDKKSKPTYSTRQRPLWDNCKLEAPDGSLLCTCDNRKAKWYMDKELGDMVSEDPLIVRLRFEPSNRPMSDSNYYLLEKQNRCVVCGHDKDYIRKFVVPFEYKKFFPSTLKDHSSHDILLLCTECHRRSCDYDALLRQRLADECNAPLMSGAAAKANYDHDAQKVRSAGRALKLNKHNIPPERVAELEHFLQGYFGVDCLTDELIENASEIDARLQSSDYIPHGKQVVRHMIMNGGLLMFMARWRKHFLDTMSPQHLPLRWSVAYVPENWIHHQDDVLFEMKPEEKLRDVKEK